jgi:uncharacterized protein YihD (DUF1040 family)
MLVRRLAASSGHQQFSDEVAGATLLKHLGAREQDKDRASFSVKLEFSGTPRTAILQDGFITKLYLDVRHVYGGTLVA